MAENENKKYLYQEYLVNCEEAIAKNMEPAHGRLYRLVHNPTIDKDLIPTSLWTYETPGGSKCEDLGSTIPEGSSMEDQENQLGDYLPSFNLTDVGAVAPFLKRYKKKNPQQREQFLLRKGSVVAAYDMRPEDGRMWVQEDGHVLLQPYEGFKLEEHEAKDFQYKHLNEYLDE